MIENDFYLTLLSNSSMKYFPNNTTTNFTTKLPKSLKLDGHWTMSLVEFQYPCSMLTVQEGENIIDTSDIHVKLLKGDSESGVIVSYDHEEAMTNRRKYTIPATNYDSISDIIKALNSIEFLKGKVVFKCDPNTNIVSMTPLPFNLDSALTNSSELKSLKLSTKLSLQLGYEPNQDLCTSHLAKHPANIQLGLPAQFFIYCDISTPQIVGDIMAPLLRVVSLDASKYTYGSNKMITFSPAYYMPVMRREFDTIEIDIRGETANPIPFEFGTTCIKLHFKRISP